MISMGGWGQGSSSASGICQGLSVGLRPWLNQSRIIHWSQAATSALTEVAGTSSWRVSRARLTSRGLGSRGLGSGKVCSIGMLRPKREPAMPMAGCSRSL
jgi:hypothetical protein